MGSAVGLLLGGIIVEYAGWEWIFFINVPVGAVVLLLALRLVPESRLEGARRHYDVAGAVLVTGSLVVLVYAISQAPEVGWGTFQTLGLIALAIAGLAAFFVWEGRTTDPLMPLRILRVRTVAGANTVGLLVGASVYSLFVLSTLYFQQLLGWSALKTGLVFLINAVASIAGAMLTEVLIPRLGPRIVMALGMSLLGLGLLCFTQVEPDSSLWWPIVPGLVLTGFGVTLSFIPVSITALSGVDPREGGLASGLIETNQSMGGALGLAIAVSIFASQLGATPSATDAADAFSVAYLFTALVAFAGAAAALLVLRGVHVETRPAEVARTATSAFSVNRNTTASLNVAQLLGQEQPDRPTTDTR
jgi:MFS family permease